MILNRADELLVDYQNGKGSEGLIQYFDSFLNSYVDFIQKGFILLEKAHLRYFISLFIKDEETRSHIKANKGVTPHDWDIIKSVIRYLKSYFLFYNDEDTFNELLIPFLTLAKRFEIEKVHFDQYVYFHYNLEITHYLRGITRDPNDYAERIATYNGEHKHIMDIQLLEKQGRIIQDQYFDIDIHDYRFMGGDEEFSGIFSKMTNIQRRILVYYYIDNLNDREISEKLGMHKRSVYRVRNKAITELEERYERKEIPCIRLINNELSLEDSEVLMKHLNSIKS